MRRSLCVTLLAAGLLACNGDLPRNSFEPAPCATDAQSDTVFDVWPRSLQLPMGAADDVYVEWWLYTCTDAVGLPASSVSREVGDTTVIVAGTAGFSEAPSFSLVPRRPGETQVSVTAGARSVVISVSVPDTTVMGASSWIAARAETSCSVASGRIFCWGGGGGSELLGGWDDPLIGTCWGSSCSPMPVPLSEGAASVYLGTGHACALDPSGVARCWGDNGALQLGQSTAIYPVVDPVEAAGGQSFSTLSLGDQHTCGLTSSGDAYCWGEHGGGRLGGNQRTGPVADPVQVSTTLRFTSIDARGEATCGSGDEGGLYCWGLFNSSTPPPPGTESCQYGGGKDGPSYVPCSFVPLLIPLDAPNGTDPVFTQLRGDCALTDDGSVFCLDRATGVFRHREGFGPYVTLTSGLSHTCALTSAGRAECWGAGSSGALGDGSRQDRERPVSVAGGHVFTAIAAGSEHTCGRTADDDVWCWGGNYVGQLGVSIVDWPFAAEPVRVRAQG